MIACGKNIVEQEEADIFKFLCPIRERVILFPVTLSL